MMSLEPQPQDDPKLWLNLIEEPESVLQPQDQIPSQIQIKHSDSNYRLADKSKPRIADQVEEEKADSSSKLRDIEDTSTKQQDSVDRKPRQDVSKFLAPYSPAKPNQIRKNKAFRKQ